MSLLAALRLPRPKSIATAAAAPADTAALAAAAQRLAAFAPRLAEAARRAEAPFIASRQARVEAMRGLAAQALERGDAAAAAGGLGELGAALDELEESRREHAAHLKRREKARRGAVQTARRLALVPAALAASRDRALDRAEAAIARAADAGRTAAADRLVDAWVAQARAWARSKDAYEALRGERPDPRELERLADHPGGDAVLDALVEDLDEDAPPAALGAALRARHGVVPVAPPAPPATAAADPPAPARSAKGLYRTLGRLPATLAAWAPEPIDAAELGGQPAPGLYCAVPGRA